MYLFEEEISEIFKNTSTYYLVLVSILLVVAPLSSVEGAHEFNAYRMHQFDFNSVSYGCRSASVNLELHSLLSWSTARHCIITWLLEMSIDQYKLVSNKAGCVLLVLPEKMNELKEDEKQGILLLEKFMMSIDTLTPTYFAHWSPALDKIASDVNHGLLQSAVKESAFEALVGSILGNRYQLVIGANKPSPVADLNIASVYGTLPGRVTGAGDADKLPTILIVAHYDAAGVAPELSKGLDNNGSGMIALFELARLFSALFATPRSHAPYTLQFLLSGGGKFNYLGTRKFLDEELDEANRRHSVDFVLCLEALAAQSDAVNFFLSKPPKSGTPVDKFHRIFARTAAKYTEGKSSSSKSSTSAESRTSSTLNVTIKHKKINLQDAWLAWEHEHFSMRKYRAFTLSTLESNRDVRRNTILDTKDSLDVSTLTRNIQILAESLASYMYNIEDASIFGSSVKVEPSSIAAHVSHLSQSRRSLQLSHAPSRSSPSLVDSLAHLLGKCLRTTSGSARGSQSVSGANSLGTSSASVRTLTSPLDRREPELVVYTASSFSQPGHVYTVKSIVLDLVLLVFISVYLAGVYYVIVGVVPKFM